MEKLNEREKRLKAIRRQPRFKLQSWQESARNWIVFCFRLPSHCSQAPKRQGSKVLRRLVQ